MPRVIDRAPLIRQEQAERQARLGLGGYGGGNGGARRPTPGQNIFQTMLTGAARGLVSVPISRDAGLAEYALRGFGIGVLGAKEDREKQQAIMVADQRYEREQFRQDAKLNLAYEKSEQDEIESARDRYTVETANDLQVDDAVLDERITPEQGERLLLSCSPALSRDHALFQMQARPR